MLAVAGLSAVVGSVLALRVLGTPDAAAGPSPPPAAGLGAQRALAELLLREAGMSSRSDPVILTDAEVNAFIEHHLEVRRARLSPLRVRLEAGRVEVTGRTTVGRLLEDQAPSWVRGLLPGPVLDLEMWPAVRGRLRVREGRGELVVEQAVLGRQAVRASWVWGMLGLDPEPLLRWRLPRTVEGIEVEEGRLLIHARPRARRSG